MKRAIAILFLVGIIAVGFSCKGDINVAPPGELYGGYEGEYRVVRNVPTGTTTKRARVEWTFESFSYNYDIIEMLQGNALCPSYGTYTREERLTLVNAQNPPPCTGDERDYPDGEFVVQTLTATDGSDSLYIVQTVSDPDTGWTKELFLKIIDTTQTP